MSLVNSIVVVFVGSLVRVADNGSGVYEVGAFKAQMFIPPPKLNSSTKASA